MWNALSTSIPRIYYYALWLKGTWNHGRVLINNTSISKILQILKTFNVFIWLDLTDERKRDGNQRQIDTHTLAGHWANCRAMSLGQGTLCGSDLKETCFYSPQQKNYFLQEIVYPLGQFWKNISRMSMEEKVSCLYFDCNTLLSWYFK